MAPSCSVAPGQVANAAAFRPRWRPSSARARERVVPDPLTLVLCDPTRLGPWLDAQGLAPGEPLAVERITTGHSNETFLVRRHAALWILRRPPRVPLAPTAHDMVREARLLRVLAGTAVPVPRLVAACPDPDVIGAPFHLTERLEGCVIRDRVPDAFLAPDARPQVGAAFIDALATLHAADWRELGLADFGRPEGFLERQVARWTKQLETYRQRPLPDMEALAVWLASHRLPPEPATIIHGDYHLDNVMYAPSLPPRVVAILDWETATIGDPLVDLGLCTALWPDPEDEPLPMGDSAPLARLGGFGSRRDLAAHYVRRSGRSVEHLPYYQALGLFRLACILEGSWARHVRGAADDPYFAALGAGVPAMARRARELCGA
jgi:aminoglycoside phosphotransferase (APT) family kinase protein